MHGCPYIGSFFVDDLVSNKANLGKLKQMIRDSCMISHAQLARILTSKKVEPETLADFFKDIPGEVLKKKFATAMKVPSIDGTFADDWNKEDGASLRIFKKGDRVIIAAADGEVREGTISGISEEAAEESVKKWFTKNVAIPFEPTNPTLEDTEYEVELDAVPEKSPKKEEEGDEEEKGEGGNEEEKDAAEGPSDDKFAAKTIEDLDSKKDDKGIVTVKAKHIQTTVPFCTKGDAKIAPHSSLSCIVIFESSSVSHHQPCVQGHQAQVHSE